MKNRAKCKKCNCIIESFTPNDVVSCDCEEITIWGGTQFLNSKAKDYANFLRIDDEGHEVNVKYVDKQPNDDKEILAKVSTNPRDSLLEMLDSHIQTYQKLPEQAMTLPVTHYDLLSFMILINELLRIK